MSTLKVTTIQTSAGGGGSGVVNSLPNNSKVMGYPAIPIKEFAKQRKKNYDD